MHTASQRLYRCQVFLWRERFKDTNERNIPSCNVMPISSVTGPGRPSSVMRLIRKHSSVSGSPRSSFFSFICHLPIPTHIHPRRPYVPLHTNTPHVRREGIPSSQDVHPEWCSCARHMFSTQNTTKPWGSPLCRATEKI